MAFQLRFPAGWKTVNQRTAVGAVSPEQDAIVVLEAAGSETDPQAALRTFLAQDGVTAGAARTQDMHGIATYRAGFTAKTSDGGELRGEVMFFSYRGSVWRMLGYSSPSRWSTYQSDISATLGSFERVTDRRVLDVQPRRLELVRTSARMTVSEFYRKYPSAVPVEEIARLNRMGVDDDVPAGTRMKRVVGDPLP